MPLPHHALTISGGCNCHAVRYRVSIPEYENRPQAPYRSPEAEMDVRLPMVVLDHCNDCRRATAAILPAVFITAGETVEVRLKSVDGVVKEDAKEQNWRASADVFLEGSELRKRSYLGHYKSSPGRNRWFCLNCGTPVGYSVDEDVIPKEWGWPKMLDLWLGTVDREDLEKDWMRPERMLWCQMGVPWIRKLASHGGGGIPEHPLTRMDRLVGDDTARDMQELAAV